MGGWPKHWVKERDGYLLVGNDTTARYESPAAFLELALTTESLASLKSQYPAPTRQLLEALSALGVNFRAIIEAQIVAGATNQKLAVKHRVDPKLIAKIRSEIGATRQTGRPRTRPSDKEVLDAFKRQESYSGAARDLGLDRRTYAKLYQGLKRKGDQKPNL